MKLFSINDGTQPFVIVVGGALPPLVAKAYKIHNVLGPA